MSFFREPQKPARDPHAASKNINALNRESVPAWRWECEKVYTGMGNSAKYIVNRLSDGWVRDNYDDEMAYEKPFNPKKMTRPQLFAFMAYKTLQHYLQTCHEVYNLVPHEMITGRHLLFAANDPQYAKRYFHWAPDIRAGQMRAIMNYFMEYREGDYLVSQNRRMPDGMIVELFDRMSEQDIFPLQAWTTVPPKYRRDPERKQQITKHRELFYTSNSGSRNFMLELGRRMDELPSYRKMGRVA